MTTPSTRGHHEHLFAIDGVWVYPPDGYQEEPVPVIGYTLAGTPVRQGYPAISFTWSFMKQEHMANLMACYRDARRGVAEITYIDRSTGKLVKAWGMMHEPVIGARQIVYYANITVKFTKIVPITQWIVDDGQLTYGYATAEATTGGVPIAANTKVERLRHTDLGTVEVAVPSQGNRWVAVDRLSAIPPDAELFA